MCYSALDFLMFDKASA